ncbi:striatin-3 isoform X3 [Macrobrachium rosenbergii]|uniref:striatin-3 isoform X3 n=1 Tax=Macrobrachium rosenbergii TaxID=79674 RepID=UPI0034D79337
MRRNFVERIILPKTDSLWEHEANIGQCSVSNGCHGMKLPTTMDEATSQNQLGGGSGTPAGVAANRQNLEEANQRLQYSIPGILHFIQHEWARFEMERSQWDLERAELQAKIAFLNGERKGQENLKNDLVRRIKMLEYALKQERAKYHKLKYGTDLVQGDMNPPSEDGGEEVRVDTDAILSTNTNVSWKQSRQLLRQYLQEIGYTDTIIDLRSNRVRSLLGISGGENEENHNNTPAMNGSDTTKRAPDPNRCYVPKKQPSTLEAQIRDAEKAVMDNFDFLQQEGMEMDDDDDVEEPEEDDDVHRIKSPKVAKTLDVDDVDGETELDHEFRFLPEMEDPSLHLMGGHRAAWTGTRRRPEFEGEEEGMDGIEEEVVDGGISSLGGEWACPPPALEALKARYRAAVGARGNPSSPQHTPPSPLTTATPTTTTTTTTALTTGVLGFGPGSRRYVGGPGGEEDALEGLGELAQLTVTNEADASYDQISSTKENFRKTWTAKYTLRSHFDGVRALCFHPTEQTLITASEDATLKLWNLQKTVPAKKSASLDVEPVYTFRGHLGPVLCLAINSDGEKCYSGGIDGTIRIWNIPSSNIDPYDSYEPIVVGGTLSGHTDAVWGLTFHSQRNHLLSCAADSTVRLWSTDARSPLLYTYAVEKDGVPTSVDFVYESTNQFVCSFNTANCVIFDIETGKPITRLDTEPDQGSNSLNRQINRVVSHPTLPLTITGHEDRHIRFWDNNSGRLVQSMVAHLDSVTSLAVDPNGLYLLSGSHDCSIRLWQLDSKQCVQEITAHRKKFDESIFDVAFHPSKPFIASAGADALAKVFV